MSQQVIIFEGADNVGKTTIAQALSVKLQIPYFKNPREHNEVMSGNTAIETRKGMMLMDFLKETGYSAIFDRNYPSEYAYSNALDREVHIEALKEMDDTYASMGALVVYLYKDHYREYEDDFLPLEKVDKVNVWYRQFLSWTKCHWIALETSDENIGRQLAAITEAAQRAAHGHAAPGLGSVGDWSRLGYAAHS